PACDVCAGADRIINGNVPRRLIAFGGRLESEDERAPSPRAVATLYDEAFEKMFVFKHQAAFVQLFEARHLDSRFLDDIVGLTHDEHALLECGLHKTQVKRPGV